MIGEDGALDIAEVAARQLADYRGRTPGTIFECASFRPSLEDAYRVQLAVAALREKQGERQVGFKVGCTGPGIRRQFGLDGPISGNVWESELHRCGSVLKAADYCQPAVEGEIAIRLGADGQPIAALPIIEIHNFVFRAQPQSLQELVVNNGIHAGVVLPCTLEVPWPADLSGSLRVLINGQVADEGPADFVPGGPERSLRWLREHLTRFGLRPFGLVLTGTALKLLPIQPGDRVRVEVGPLGYAHVAFA